MTVCCTNLQAHKCQRYNIVLLNLSWRHCLYQNSLLFCYLDREGMWFGRRLAAEYGRLSKVYLHPIYESSGRLCYWQRARTMPLLTAWSSTMIPSPPRPQSRDPRSMTSRKRWSSLSPSQVPHRPTVLSRKLTWETLPRSSHWAAAPRQLHFPLKQKTRQLVVLLPSVVGRLYHSWPKPKLTYQVLNCCGSQFCSRHKRQIRSWSWSWSCWGYWR